MKKLLLAAVAVTGLSFGQAHAVPIMIDGTKWDVTTIPLGILDAPESFEANETLLKDQVWFGDETRALDFATAVDNTLALASRNTGDGPYFAWGLSKQSGVAFAACPNNSCSSNFFVPPSNSFVVYAKAEPVLGVSEPGTLVLLAVGLFGIGFARRRRSRPIQLASP